MQLSSRTDIQSTLLQLSDKRSFRVLWGVLYQHYIKSQALHNTHTSYPSKLQFSASVESHRWLVHIAGTTNLPNLYVCCVRLGF